METVVVSLGGSVLAAGEPDPEYLRELAAMVRDLSSSYRLFLVTGGGRIARAYIAAGRALGAPEEVLDGLGIQATRINARLLMAALGLEDDRVAHTVKDAAANEAGIVVMGGTDAGHTTDAVAAELAIAVKAVRLVNATAVDGVYTADPAMHPGAERLERLTHEELVALVGTGHEKAGPNVVFDPKAARLAADAKLPISVVNGRDLGALREAIRGRPFAGTIVESK